MTPWLEDADVTLYHGDVLTTLRELPAESVDCVVTSPPYWGLRDYGQEGQLGLEPTPEQYVESMVEVFREVRRVLAAHGTVWLNLGDSYNANTGKGFDTNQDGDVNDKKASAALLKRMPWGKPKDLVGIPWRVAFALQQDGWYLRSDIIWAKPNPMPESVTDRPTKAHEYVFLLSKQPRYFFDQEAVREPHSESTFKYNPRFGTADNIVVTKEQPYKCGPRDVPDGVAGRWENRYLNPAGRNIRSVWEIATQPYPEAHFATFPEELARRCIAAGTSERGKCPECGAPWVREVERTPSTEGRRGGSGNGSYRTVGDNPHHGTLSSAGSWNTQTLGWKSSCPASCVNGEKFRTQVPCVVLDPFMGSGTVAYVARKLGRHAVGIDLSAEYLELAARRLQQQSLLWREAQ